MIDAHAFKELQVAPLRLKLMMTQARIQEWYEHHKGNVYVSFSGGKDSTVLLDIVRKMYSDIPVVFCDTGLEYPEIREFVQSCRDITIIRPKMSFLQVLQKYGYPVISKEQAQFIHEARTTKSDVLRDLRLHGRVYGGKRSTFGGIAKKWLFMLDAPFKISHKCCEIIKKNPFRAYAKETGRVRITGEMAQDSRLRKTKYLKEGCNAFQAKDPYSMPLGFWAEQDILEYIFTNKVPYCSVYGDISRNDGVYKTTGVSRTGCMFCCFGLHMEESTRENKFQIMKRTHPVQYAYCMNQLGIHDVLSFMGLPH